MPLLICTFLSLLSCLLAFFLPILLFSFSLRFQVLLWRLAALLRRSSYFVKTLLELSVQNSLQLDFFIALRKRHRELVDELLHLLGVGRGEHALLERLLRHQHDLFILVALCCLLLHDLLILAREELEVICILNLLLNLLLHMVVFFNKRANRRKLIFHL